MDTTILGLLMLKNWTIYELRKQIEISFTSVSSNSMGSIQAAIKKLLEKGYISYTEHVEKSVNKKVYHITATGKKQFFANISKPMKYKEKNVELNKFYFMGFLGTDTQIQLLDGYIAELQQERQMLQEIQMRVEKETFDENDLHSLQNLGAQPEIWNPENGNTALEMIRQISTYQYATLYFSLEKIEFEINWFEKFRKSLLERKEGTND